MNAQLSAPAGPDGAHGDAQSGNQAAPLVVFVGRPNSGKSSLFNALTGSTAHVGNFPGITVDVLEAEVDLANGEKVVVADLPGLYTIDAIVDDATDEGVARRFLDEAKRSGRRVVVVHVADANALALHLKLTRELAALGLPLLVVATQSDLLQKSGRTLDAPALEEALGTPVLLASARDKEARTRCLAAIECTLARDPEAKVASSFDPNAVAERVLSKAASTSSSATERLDAALLHPLLGPVLFVAIMGALFAAVFLVADPATTVLDASIAWLRGRLEALMGKGVFTSLITDGLLGGAGTVLAFLPQIVILTLAMELLEASGYLARGAFLVDRLLRVMGLSGRSFVPLLMGHACAVPAIAATRIVRDPRERLVTILVLPLMTCSARIPTYALIVSAFFFKASVLAKAGIFIALYLCGALTGLVASLVLRRGVVRGKTLPLVLEMPPYRMPQPTVVARQAWRGATRFLREVGSTILVASALLWAVLTVPAPGTHASPDAPAIERSVAASVGRALEPVTKPLGFDWRINVGLIGSFGARELMVGTLGIIFGIDDAGAAPEPLSKQLREATKANGEPLYPARTGLALIAFFVIACQCMSTLAAIRRETRGFKWPAFVLAYTYAAAYAAAAVTYGVAKTLGL